MLRAARQNVPPELATSSDPLLLRMIATTPNAAAEPRLIAAERAEAFGSLSSEALAQLYDSVAFTPEQLANALTFAQGDRGPRGRAVMYRAAKAQTSGLARAEALQRSWKLARERGGYATAVRVALPLLLEMPPASELSFFAADAVRALLFTGKIEEARRWRTLVKAEAMAGNEAATASEALVWPLLWLADAEERKNDKTPLATRFAAWRQAQEKVDAAAQRGRSALLATLIVSSGERPDPAIINALLPSTLTREPAPMPNLGLWLGVGAALESGRVAETALFAIDMLGPEGAAGASPPRPMPEPPPMMPRSQTGSRERSTIRRRRFAPSAADWPRRCATARTRIRTRRSIARRRRALASPPRARSRASNCPTTTSTTPTRPMNWSRSSIPRLPPAPSSSTPIPAASRWAPRSPTPIARRSPATR